MPCGQGSSYRQCLLSQLSPAVPVGTVLADAQGWQALLGGSRLGQPAPRPGGPYPTGRICGLLRDADQVTLLVRRGLAVQNVLLGHAEVPVLPRDVPVLQRDGGGWASLPSNHSSASGPASGPAVSRSTSRLGKEVRLQKAQSPRPTGEEDSCGCLSSF